MPDAIGTKVGTAAWVGALLLVCMAGCDSVTPSAFESEVLVESYQEAGARLAPVRLGRTVPIDATYDLERQAVRGARVAVHLLGEDGTVEAVYPYAEADEGAGLYVARTDERVLPQRTYALDVTLPDGGRVTAQTVVPDTFSIVKANADTLVYQDPRQLALTVTRSDYPGRQGVFLFTTEALEPTEENMVPITRARLEQEEDAQLQEFQTSSSPPLNEANYEVNPDGSLTIRLPWFAVAFYGQNRTSASGLDDNLFDFIRSQIIQQGGSTLAPGEIPNVIEHVEGGTGIFGSFARVTYWFYIARP